MIFFVLLFSSSLSNIFAQTLSVCTSGDCTWNDPSSDIIPVCTKTATSCTVTVSGSHSNGKVYSAAPNTHIDCNGISGCRYGEYHCGNELPPNYASYGLTASDFDGTVNDCYFDCTNANTNVCYDTNFYCKGDVKQCRIKGSGGASLHDATLFCSSITNPLATCSWDCPCCISCDRSSMQCTDTMAVCYKSGSNSGNVNIVTSAPTTSPTNKPTTSPTLYPTKYPSVSPTTHTPTTTEPTIYPTFIPTVQPTFVPTIEPSTIPTQIPTNSPSKIPSNFPTKVPSNSPTQIPSNSPSKKPSHSPSKKPSNPPSITVTLEEYVSTESTGCIGNCGDTLNATIYGMNKNVVFVIIGGALCVCCVLTIFVIRWTSLSNKKLKNELTNLEKAQSVSSNNGETVDTVIFKNNKNIGETDDTLNNNVQFEGDTQGNVVTESPQYHDNGNIDDDDDEDLYGLGNVTLTQNGMDMQTPNAVSLGNDNINCTCESNSGFFEP